MLQNILQSTSGVPHAVFPDDFDEVAARFAEIIRTRSWRGLLGGVYETLVPHSTDYAPLELNPSDFRGYRMDAGPYIERQKTILLKAFAAVERRDLRNDQLTLCPSTSFGILAVLLKLRSDGVRTVLLEAPTYFAIKAQAEALGFRVLLQATDFEDGGCMTPEDLQHFLSSDPEPFALFITQPRFAYGFCRTREEILGLAQGLRKTDTLIIDEAADQSCPPPSAGLESEAGPSIIRIRGFTKGLGLNGVRVAAVLHAPSMRNSFVEIMAYTGGALDAGSLEMALQIGSSPDRYVAYLRAAQRFVLERRRLVEAAFLGAPVIVCPIESGYIATIAVAIEKDETSYWPWRERFLEVCVAERTPVVLGSSMYFPYNYRTELIRVNYFTPEDELLRAARSLNSTINSTI